MKSRNIKEKLITKKKRAKERRECSVFMLMSMRALVLNFGQVYKLFHFINHAI